MKPNVFLAILAIAASVSGQGVVSQGVTNPPVRALPRVIPGAPVVSEATNSLVAPPPTFQGISRALTMPTTPTLELPHGVLTFDREMAVVAMTNGDPEARFLFYFTNTSPAQIADLAARSPSIAGTPAAC